MTGMGEPSRAGRGLRVMMIAPTPFFSHRGCHVRILEEERALRRSGANVTICTYFLGEDPPGVDVRRARRLPGYRKRSAGPAWGKVLLDGFLWRLCRETARAVRPHVIHAHLHEGIAIARRLPRGDAVRILDVQGGLTDETLAHGFLPDLPPLRDLLARIEGLLDRSADFVVTSHTDAANVLTSRFGVPAARVRAIGDAGSATMPDTARMEAARARFGLQAGEPLFLYAGLLGRHQGTHHLLDLARALRAGGSKARVLALGYPEEPWRAESEREGLAPWIRFGGRFLYEDHASLLALGTVALSPKTSTTEGNQKLCGYLEAGLPTVAFDTPATREILGDAGILVPNGEGDAFARAAMALIGDAERLRDLAARSRRRAREIGSWDGVAIRLLDAYRAAGARWDETGRDPRPSSGGTGPAASP